MQVYSSFAEKEVALSLKAFSKLSIDFSELSTAVIRYNIISMQHILPVNGDHNIGLS